MSTPPFELRPIALGIIPFAAYPQPANGVCNHEAVHVKFDALKARNMSTAQIRETYPRFAGTCPQCRQQLIKYASMEHYTMGDW